MDSDLKQFVNSFVATLKKNVSCLFCNSFAIFTFSLIIHRSIIMYYVMCTPVIKSFSPLSPNFFLTFSQTKPSLSRKKMLNLFKVSAVCVSYLHQTKSSKNCKSFNVSSVDVLPLVVMATHFKYMLPTWPYILSLLGKDRLLASCEILAVACALY